MAAHSDCHTDYIKSTFTLQAYISPDPGICVTIHSLLGCDSNDHAFIAARKRQPFISALHCAALQSPVYPASWKAVKAKYMIRRIYP